MSREHDMRHAKRKLQAANERDVEGVPVHDERSQEMNQDDEHVQVQHPVIESTVHEHGRQVREPSRAQHRGRRRVVAIRLTEGMF